MDIKRLQDMPSWEWPPDADKMLLRVLRNRAADRLDRIVAAELAGDLTVIDDNLAEELLSIVKRNDEEDELRSAAVIALGPVLEYTYDEIDMPDDMTISAAMFNRIQDTLHRLYMDMNIPKEVRRRIIEASVRAPQDWHRPAVAATYESDDEEWKLTAVFCMGFIEGFNNLIMDALNSKDPDIYYEAICAAGNWGLDGAWPHIVSIVTGREADKALLLAAIEATVSIRPQETAEVLSGLLYEDDEDIIEAVHEAMAMAEAMDELDDTDDDPPDKGGKTLH